MVLFASIVSATAVLLGLALTLLFWIIIASAVMSWLSPDPSNPIVRFCQAVNAPLLIPLRRYIPLIAGRIDITPIIALAVIQGLQSLLVPALARYGQVLG